ncbi:MAG: transposase, partial [Acidimicrobiia bacterium]|nr:transposase [Acidimicrobiia bacterium]
MRNSHRTGRKSRSGRITRDCRPPACSTEGNNLLDTSSSLPHNGFMAAEPKTLQDAILYFADQDNCLNYLIARRWPKGVTCPRCGSDNVG